MLSVVAILVLLMMLLPAAPVWAQDSVQQLQVTPDSLTLAVSETAQLQVKAIYSDNSVADVTNEASYASGNESVATVSPTGLVTAVSAGETVVTATYGGKTAQAMVTVTQTQTPPPDTTPPTVTNTDPANGNTAVPVDKTITLTFSEDVQEGPAYGSILVKDAAGNLVAVTASIAGKVLSLKPNTSLAYSTEYAVTVPAGAVKDQAGNSLQQEYIFSFTTEAGRVRSTAPEILSATATIAGQTVDAQRTGVNTFQVDLTGHSDSEYLTDIVLNASADAASISFSLKVPWWANLVLVSFGLNPLSELNITKQFINGQTAINTKEVLGPYDTGREGISLGLIKKLADAQGNLTLSGTLTSTDGATTNVVLLLHFRPSWYSWVLGVYMCADNDLNDAAWADVMEMATAGSSNDVKVAGLFDSASAGGAYYEITTDHQIRTVNLPEPNMGDPATLSQFLNWMKVNYPAEHYALVIWDHGGGFRSKEEAQMRRAAVDKLLNPASQSEKIKGVAFDDTNGDYLTIPEVREAIAASELPSIDLIAFDACLMQQVEVGYELRKCAGVMVGSEELVPWQGFPYDKVVGWLLTNPTAPASDFGKAIVDAYVAAYPDWGVQLSAVDLSQLGGVAQAASDLANLLISNFADYSSPINDAVWGTQWYGWGDYVDLYDFTLKLDQHCGGMPGLTEKTGVLRQALASATIYSTYSGSAVAGSHGLAVWLPWHGYCGEEFYYLLNTLYQPLQFAQDTSWDEFLKVLVLPQDVTNLTVTPQPGVARYRLAFTLPSSENITAVKVYACNTEGCYLLAECLIPPFIEGDNSSSCYLVPGGESWIDVSLPPTATLSGPSFKFKVVVKDASGNESPGVITEQEYPALVYLPLTRGPGGWRAFSTPVAISTAVIGETIPIEAVEIAYKWDPDRQQWVQVTEVNNILQPLEAVYVKLKENAMAVIKPTTTPTAPPCRTLKEGWNLIGFTDVRKLDSALYTLGGCWGALVSPSVNPNAWAVTPADQEAWERQVNTHFGYWVFVQPGCTGAELAGFTSTPIKVSDYPPVDPSWS